MIGDTYHWAIDLISLTAKGLILAIRTQYLYKTALEERYAKYRRATNLFLVAVALLYCTLR